MMKWLLFAFALLLASPASAQSTVCASPGGKAYVQTAGCAQVGTAAAGYTGPGDVVSGAYLWFGLRAYSSAKRGTAAINLCDNTLANCSDISTNASTGILNAGGTHGANNCDTSGTCLVKILYDQTGSLNCAGASCDVSCSVAATCPAFTPNCIGSLPCMTFAKASSQVLSAGTFTMTTQAQPYSFSAVANYTAADGAFSGILSLGSGSLGIGNDFGSTGVAFILDNSGAHAPTATATDNATHALQYVVNGATPNSIITVDGSDTTVTLDTASLSNTSANVLVGALGGPNHFYGGHIFETGFWGVGFTGPNRTALNSNQHTYWGF